ncbi:hypothetical protein B0H13DRAFT_2655278 [Mycena leptocephala]|nr:hypothetical protein B0H13DRAFT_2655278 [Mycena leptocephala]
MYVTTPYLLLTDNTLTTHEFHTDQDGSTGRRYACLAHTPPPRRHTPGRSEASHYVRRRQCAGPGRPLRPRAPSCAVLRCLIPTRLGPPPSQSDNKVPGVGSSGFLSSYRDAFKLPFNLIQQGFDQNPKVSSASRGCIAGNTSCAGPSSLKVGNTPKNVLAFYKGVEEIDLESLLSASHVDFVNVVGEYRGRPVPPAPHQPHPESAHAFPHVRDEIVCAFNQELHWQGSEWSPLPILPTTMSIVRRVIGLPL